MCSFIRQNVIREGIRVIWLACLIGAVIQPRSSSGTDLTRFERNAIAVPTSVYGGFLVDRDTRQQFAGEGTLRMV